MHDFPFVYNFPFFSIILTLAGGMAMPFIRNGRVAQKVNLIIVMVAGALNCALLVNLVMTQQNFTYMMGHWPAPYGNEIRGGPLEALMATVFCIVEALSLVGGLSNIYKDVPKKKQNLYFLMMNLILCSLIALVYTNDMFTGYVFIEINTIAACAIVMSKDSSETTVSTVRYLIMSQIGSGLVLMGLALAYNVTGQLLMVSLHDALGQFFASEMYLIPIAVITGIIAVGLAIKSALYPFHSWLPGAHGSATTASSAILSGLVLKGYIIFLIKIIYRVYTPEVFAQLHVGDALLVLGVLSMILGSVKALKERHIKRMTAYSTVAQIGYIFMGIGLNSEIGMMAACFQILSHAVTKPMLFIAAGGLANVSGHSYDFKDLRGSAHRNKVAGVAFVIGALSMIGIPVLAGFPPKIFFSIGAIQSDWFRLPVVLGALAISTLLNALYYLPVCFNIWKTKPEAGHGHGHGEEEHVEEAVEHVHSHAVSKYDGNDEIIAFAENELSDGEEKITFGFKFSCISFIVLNFALGIFFDPVMKMIQMGLHLL